MNRYLRESAWPWAKSAYAITVNPWPARDDIEAALFFRGTIVSAYGYIETRLAEVAIATSTHPDYTNERDTYPYGMSGRIAYLRKIASYGPLQPYGRLLASFLKQFEDAAELRHIMAHAQMEQTSDPTGWGVTFYNFHPAGGDKRAVNYRRDRFRLAELEAWAWKSARLSRLCQRLCFRLDSLHLFDP